MSGETEQSVSSWTIDSLKEHLESQLRERDRRYEQRFEATERAIELALEKTDQGFREHIRQVRDETAAALSASDKAIQKSETSMERRFESVNEFRAQLGDQAATFMPRKESEARHQQAQDKLNALEKQITEQLGSLRSRLDRYEGSAKGEQLTMGKIYAGLAAAATLITLVIMIANNRI